jgi:hypothetical protein
MIFNDDRLKDRLDPQAKCHFFAKCQIEPTSVVVLPLIYHASTNQAIPINGELNDGSEIES